MQLLSKLVLNLVEFFQGLELGIYMIVQVHRLEEGDAECLGILLKIVEHLAQHHVLLGIQLLLVFQDLVQHGALLVELQENVLQFEKRFQVRLQRRDQVEVHVRKYLIYVRYFLLLVRFFQVQVLRFFEELVDFLYFGVVDEPVGNGNVLPCLTWFYLLRLLLF